MIYLVIMVAVAGTGLVGLWVHQRRERAHLGSVDGFRASLERLSDAPMVTPARRAPRRAGARAARSHPMAHGRSPAVRRTNVAPLDPARRAAAKRRIEARRAAARTRAL